ncbi:malto-oligosyltrehalose trehalohydrolase [Cupriavidus sp. USMAA2-4]|uniref:malto-oligosyltrehalose trehalohydrolase n=1 Tax=Cupriavidus sp. USMAA2-4 TaxID=876364 RepID=UPI0009FEE7FF|nr:malto-oligosyltrehalose trehalohydrolase [Cupriavidus sp. USMAA2-4]
MTDSGCQRRGGAFGSDSTSTAPCGPAASAAHGHSAGGAPAATHAPHDYAFGPAWLPDGQVLFRLWAPDAQRQGRAVALELAGTERIRMAPGDDGWFRALAPCRDGTRYRFRLDDGTAVPDPASRWQPDDVRGASVACLPEAVRAYPWQRPDWHGRPWHEAILYEMHVGLCGGYAGATAQLERLAAMGFTAVELMPLAEFPGRRNWGYDGVLLFAPESSYGTPDALRALVDRAHCLGMMVLLDVVYNHFGPEGNYLPRYAASFFRADRHTPWGAAIDFRQPEVRRFFTENARYWLDEFRFDGLRLDAVHAIEDEGWLAELPAALRASLPGARTPRRRIHLILENDHNDAGLLHAGYDAQWNDDAHHALHVLLTGETAGHYHDYTAAAGTAGTDRSEIVDGQAAGSPPLRHLARVLSQGFAWQGEVSPYRTRLHGGAAGQAVAPVRRGRPSAQLPPTAFVCFLQNHDQVGNRALGERLTTLAGADALRAAVALQLLCPQIPLVFMGEEGGASTPFLYFTDHPPPLAAAIRAGRRREFAATAPHGDDARLAAVPDPNDPAAFEASRPCLEPESEWTHYYRTLLAIRRRQLLPRLAGCRSAGVDILGTAALCARWRLGDGTCLTLWLNLGGAPVPCGTLPAEAILLHESGVGRAAALERGILMPCSAIATLCAQVAAHDHVHSTRTT